MIKKKLKAQSLIEYAFILALVAILAIAALHLAGNRINRPKAKPQVEKAVQSSEDKNEESSCSEIGGNWDKEAKVCSPN